VVLGRRLVAVEGEGARVAVAHVEEPHRATASALEDRGDERAIAAAPLEPRGDEVTRGDEERRDGDEPERERARLTAREARVVAAREPEPARSERGERSQRFERSEPLGGAHRDGEDDRCDEGGAEDARPSHRPEHPARRLALDDEEAPRARDEEGVGGEDGERVGARAAPREGEDDERQDGPGDEERERVALSAAERAERLREREGREGRPDREHLGPLLGVEPPVGRLLPVRPEEAPELVAPEEGEEGAPALGARGA